METWKEKMNSLKEYNMTSYDKSSLKIDAQNIYKILLELIDAYRESNRNIIKELKMDLNDCLRDYFHSLEILGRK